tara:strand:+ start:38 stop:586 length:549 start_codon:yes stop_codon:yes gene_type:complete
MDPATIALSIAACKKVAETCVDIKDLTHSLDSLFGHQDAHEENKKSNKKPTEPSTRMQQVLKIRAGDEGYDDDTAISAVANDVLAQKQNDLALKGLAREIDRKWGMGTWDTIIEERDKRLKAKEESKKKAKEVAKKRQIETDAKWDKAYYWLKEFGKLILIFVIFGIIAWVVIANKCTGSSC